LRQGSQAGEPSSERYDMLNFLKRLFSDQSNHWVESLDDPVLGTLKLNEDATWWESAVTTSSGEVTICVPGEKVPDPRCLAAAADFVNQFETTSQEVIAFLREEAGKKRWGFYRSIIPNLGIAGVFYQVQDNHISAMIDLGEDETGRAWRCAFDGGSVSNLAFDS
jgi:hypothetical protein